VRDEVWMESGGAGVQRGWPARQQRQERR